MRSSATDFLPRFFHHRQNKTFSVHIINVWLLCLFTVHSLSISIFIVVLLFSPSLMPFSFTSLCMRWVLVYARDFLPATAAFLFFLCGAFSGLFQPSRAQESQVVFMVDNTKMFLFFFSRQSRKSNSWCCVILIENRNYI